MEPKSNNFPLFLSMDLELAFLRQRQFMKLFDMLTKLYDFKFQSIKMNEFQIMTCPETIG